MIITNAVSRHDFPAEATFLSEEDRRRVIRRLKLDKQSSAEHEEFKLSYFWSVLKDWKTYTGMIVSLQSPLCLAFSFDCESTCMITSAGNKAIRACRENSSNFNRSTWEPMGLFMRFRYSFVSIFYSTNTLLHVN